MPVKDWRLRIMDILEAIRRIQTYTAGMNREALAADPKTLDAILRNLVVIGEAVRHIPDEITMRFTDVPWDRMRAMRNFLIHEYPSVDPNIVWDTTQIDLPPLSRSSSKYWRLPVAQAIESMPSSAGGAPPVARAIFPFQQASGD